MKNKLTFKEELECILKSILFTIVAGSFTLLLSFLFVEIAEAQSVPNTTTFTLQNVVDVVDPTIDDLVGCIADAIESYYNPTYYTAPATSLLEFRDYGIHNSAPYYVDNGGLASTTSSTMNVPYPSGVDDGDGLLLVFKIYATDVGTGSPPSAPSGWTLIGFNLDFGYDFYAAVYYRVPTGSLSGSVSLTNTYPSTINQNGIIYRYSNVAGADATLASTGMYYTTSFSTTPTPDTGDLGIVTTVHFISGTVTITGDFTEDSKIVDGGTSSTFAAVSVVGDGTQKTASYSVASSLNFVMSGFSFY